ncbi:MAG: hypothetical protein Q4D54_01985 [Eubacteriales bacterium]|nr:hypothetical protein [Eubacteriales bacterium]
MKGKEKCRALKELRLKIAEANDIEYAVNECKYQGDCKGTCPKCEEELRYLERELERRTKLGKTVVLAGLSSCLAGFVAGCHSDDAKNPWSNSNSGAKTTTEMRLDGDMEYVEPSTEGDYEGGEMDFEEENLTTTEETLGEDN